MKLRHTAVALVAALGLSSCVGIGAVNQDGVDRRARERGGGITADLVDDALGAVADEAGGPPRVHTLTAQLAQVTLVVAGVPATRREQWRYGTSGLYGGRGLEGPEPVRSDGGEGSLSLLFTAEEAGLDRLDALVDRALDQAALPGAWVETVTVTRPGPGRPPTFTFLVTDAFQQETVVLEAGR